MYSTVNIVFKSAVFIATECSNRASFQSCNQRSQKGIGISMLLLLCNAIVLDLRQGVCWHGIPISVHEGKKWVIQKCGVCPHNLVQKCGDRPHVDPTKPQFQGSPYEFVESSTRWEDPSSNGTIDCVRAGPVVQILCQNNS